MLTLGYLFHPRPGVGFTFVSGSRFPTGAPHLALVEQQGEALAVVH